MIREIADIQFQSASLVALFAMSLEHADDEALIKKVFKQEPILFSVGRSAFGNIGLICLPIMDQDMFCDMDKTVKLVLDGVALAAKHGANTVSCTGMIPAATNGLLAVKKAMDQGMLSQYSELQIITGHETVAAAFVLNINKACEVANRDFKKEKVTFVGLGHIGASVLELLMCIGQFPHSINLVDVVRKERKLEALRRKLKDSYTYKGKVNLIFVPKTSSFPQQLYDETTFIVGATSSPEIIDIDHIKPGTIIVDDSFPLGFDSRKAVKRWKEKKDILITIAGALASTHKGGTIEFFPTGSSTIDHALSQIMMAGNINPYSLTGCAYSAVLTRHFKLPCSLGSVKPENALSQYNTLKKHGFSGTAIYTIHITKGGAGVYFPEPEMLDYFRTHFEQNSGQVKSHGRSNVVS